MLEVHQVDPKTAARLEGIKIDLPVLAYVGVDNGEIVGSGGLAWGGGRCWIWMKTNKVDKAYSLTIVHWTKKLLRKAWQLGETEVFTPRDTEYPTSERLLKALGFRLYGIEKGQEIWRHLRQ